MKLIGTKRSSADPFKGIMAWAGIGNRKTYTTNDESPGVVVHFLYCAKWRMWKSLFRLWRDFGRSIGISLARLKNGDVGDILTFKRNGGGHVNLSGRR
jgi:hypothetical protein